MIKNMATPTTTTNSENGAIDDNSAKLGHTYSANCDDNVNFHYSMNDYDFTNYEGSARKYKDCRRDNDDADIDSDINHSDNNNNLTRKHLER